MCIAMRGVILIGLAVSGCAGLDPVMYTGLASSPKLSRNTTDETGRRPYEYAPPVDWSRYDKVIVERAEVYRGAEQQFGDLSAEDKRQLAHDLQEKFTDQLKSRFALSGVPSSTTLRIKLTLTGVKTTPAVIGTLSHLDMAGGLYNGVQTMRDKEGLLTGSVIYAVEVFDSSTNRLLKAYVSKQYPSPLNIGASIGSLEAAKVGIEKGAEDLVAQLR